MDSVSQTCFTKKSFAILGKLTGKHLWWSLFSGFRSATLVKKILMNKPFSVNGFEHLWTSASEFKMRMSTILFVLLYIRYKEIQRCTLDCIVKWTINCNVKCIFFLTFFCNFFVLLKIKSHVHLQVRRRVPPQVHLLLNYFVNSFMLTSAPPCPSSNVTQLQPKVHS